MSALLIFDFLGGKFWGGVGCEYQMEWSVSCTWTYQITKMSHRSKQSRDYVSGVLNIHSRAQCRWDNYNELYKYRLSGCRDHILQLKSAFEQMHTNNGPNILHYH